MVILNLKLDNIYLFNEFNVNFSYPKKLTNSLIENEFIQQQPSFRYKKLNIFIGANATGKTSLIKAIWFTLYFLTKRERETILRMINPNKDNAYIEIDLVDSLFLYRIKIKVNKIELENGNIDNELKVAYVKLELKDKDSYESRVADLDNAIYVFNDYREALDEIDINSSWRTALPARKSAFDEISFLKVPKELEDEYTNTLYNVLNTLDPSITSVFKSSDSDDAYVIVHENSKNIILQEGTKLSTISLLSSGTKYGISIANMMYSIKHHLNGIYLIDEQFSYVNADVEAAILSTMVSNLGPNEQIFFTTHNTKLLNMSFPTHSLYFMKKEIVDGKSNITIDCASYYENRNNVSVKNMFENDAFGTTPKLDNIFNIGE